MPKYKKNRLKIRSGNVHKLISTLYHKEKYVLHEENLKLYLRLGLKLKKVHRVLEFNQKSWLKGCIDFNTEKKKEAKHSFEKDFFNWWITMSSEKRWRISENAAMCI